MICPTQVSVALPSCSTSSCSRPQSRRIKEQRPKPGCPFPTQVPVEEQRGADNLSPTEEVRGSGAESYTYLPRSLDVEVVEPFQDRNPGHHPNGGVVKVAVQHLNYAIEVQGHLDPFRAAKKRKRPGSAL